jgi:hypothetical protein
MGVAEKDLPTTRISEYLITPTPYFEGKDKKFKTEASLILKAIEPGIELYYNQVSLYGKPAANGFRKYSKPFLIKNSATVYAYAMKNGQKSKRVMQHFYRIPEDKIVQVLSPVNPLYTAGGPDALIDGITGEANYRTGEWQSYEGTDFEALIDLKKRKPVTYVAAHFLQDVGSWIWMPAKVIFEASEDNIHFTLLGEVNNTVSDKTYNPSVKEFGVKTNLLARYIRLKAINYGKIPDWHAGKGGDAHIFIDEVIIK